MTAPRHEPWPWHALLIVVPLVGTLWVPLYDRAEPSFAGFPFFYWYLFLWIILVAVLSGVVYLRTRRAS